MLPSGKGRDSAYALDEVNRPGFCSGLLQVIPVHERIRLDAYDVETPR